MKAFYLLVIFFTINGFAIEITMKKTTQGTPRTHSFQDVWHEVTSNPLATLPQNTVTFGKLFTFTKNIILGDAKRTLEDHRDIID